MDALKLDPQVLEDTAAQITNYCVTQNQVMDDYLSRMSSLQNEWTDDQTIGPLLEEIRLLKSSIINLMNEIHTIYPNYFREKAEQIRRRPTF